MLALSALLTLQTTLALLTGRAWHALFTLLTLLTAQDLRVIGDERVHEVALERRVVRELSRDLSGVSVCPLRAYGPLLTSLTSLTSRTCRADSSRFTLSSLLAL